MEKAHFRCIPFALVGSWGSLGVFIGVGLRRVNDTLLNPVTNISGISRGWERKPMDYFGKYIPLFLAVKKAGFGYRWQPGLRLWKVLKIPGVWGRFSFDEFSVMISAGKHHPQTLWSISARSQITLPVRRSGHLTTHSSAMQCCRVDAANACLSAELQPAVHCLPVHSAGQLWLVWATLGLGERGSCGAMPKPDMLEWIWGFEMGNFWR